MKARKLLVLFVVLAITGSVIIALWLYAVNKVSLSQPMIVEQLSQRFKNKVDIESIELALTRGLPAIYVNQANIISEETNRSLLFVENLKLQIDWLALLFHQELQIKTLELHGAELEIRCEESYRCAVEGLKIDPSTSIHNILNLLANHYDLSVKDSSFVIVKPDLTTIELTKANFLYFHRDKQKFRIKGRGEFTENTVPVDFDISFIGDPDNSKDGQFIFNVATDLVNAGSFQQIFPTISIERLTDVELSGEWHHGIQDLKVEGHISELQLPNLTVENARINLTCSDKCQQGTIELDDIDLNYGGQLYQIDRFSSAMTLKPSQFWQVQLPGWQLEKDQHSLSGTLRLDGYQQKIEQLQLSTQLQDLSLDQVKQYLPTKVISKKVIAWINESIHQATLCSTSLNWKSGQWRWQTEIENAEFEYVADWPKAGLARALMTMDNKQIAIQSDLAKMGGQDFPHIQAVINYLDDAHMQITSDIHGQAENYATDVLAKMPLTKVNQTISQLAPQGNLRGTINLRTPFKDIKESIQVDGELFFDQTTAQIPNFDVEVKQANGSFIFDRHSFQTKDVSLQLFNKPGQLSAKFHVDGHPQLQMKLNGSVDFSQLKNIQTLPIHGVTPFRAELTWPYQNDNGWYIKFNSDLVGAQLDLPASLKKAKNTKVPSSLILEHSGDQTRVAVVIEHRLAHKFKLIKGKIHSSHVVIDKNPKADWLKASESIISGKIEDLNWQQLSEWMDRYKTERQLPVHIDFHTNGMDFYNQKLHDVWLKYQSSNDTVMIDSREVIGHIRLPSDNNPSLMVSLDKLHMNAKDNQKSADVELKQKLPIEFYCNDFQWNDTNLGQVQLSLQPRHYGYDLSEINVRGKHFTMNGVGQWNQTKKVTQLAVNINSSNVGDMFKQIGYKSSIAEGKGQVTLNTTWPNHPWAGKLETMSGNVSIDLKSGEFTSMEPGIGKVLSLLSVESIQRRLQLDFRDIFKKGLYFDKFQAQINFANNQASTDNLLIEGPSSRIELGGDLSFVDMALDAQMQVTPKVGASVPIAAAIAAGNPAIGAAFWLIDRASGSKMSEFNKYHYKVSGTLAKPKLLEIEDTEKKS